MSQRKVLIQSAFGRWPMLEFELDIVQRELDQGSTVYFAFCRGGKDYCSANNPKPEQKFEQSKCIACKSRVKRGLQWLEDSNGKLIPLDYKSVNKIQEKRISSLWQKILEQDFPLEIKYLGLSTDEKRCWFYALSGLNTDLRSATVDLGLHRRRFGLMFVEALTSHYSAEAHVQQLRPDYVYLYNARMPRYGPVVDILERTGTPFAVYEYPSVGETNYLLSPGFRPHDFADFVAQNKKRFFSLPDADQHDFREIAKDWLNKRSKRILDGRQKKLIGVALDSIESRKMPIDWDVHAPSRTVAVFPSSQYEFVNVQSHARSMALEQASVIQKALVSFPDVHFFVRMHPAQPDTDQPFVSDVLALQALPNCTVLPPSSGIDSYELGANCDAVITFGSTIGVELAFQGKFVIECGSHKYSLFGATTPVFSDAQLQNSLEKCLAAAPKSSADGQLRDAAVNAVAADLSVGRKPIYIERSSGSRPKMVRRGKTYVVEAYGVAKFVSNLSSPGQVLRSAVDPWYRRARRLFSNQ